jgi:hydrogenase maturation protease
MTKLLIIGVGSPFGDDQLGWQVVNAVEEQLSAHGLISEGLKLICADRPGLHLLELMREAESVILIDAVKTNALAGTIHCFQTEDLTSSQLVHSSHAVGVSEALQLGEALGMLPDSIIIYGIEIGTVGFDGTTSKPIQDAVARLADIIVHCAVAKNRNCSRY